MIANSLYLIHNHGLCQGLWPRLGGLQLLLGALWHHIGGLLPHFRALGPHFVGLQPCFGDLRHHFVSFGPLLGNLDFQKSRKSLKILQNHANAKIIPKNLEKRGGQTYRQTEIA